MDQSTLNFIVHAINWPLVAIVAIIAYTIYKLAELVYNEKVEDDDKGVSVGTVRSCSDGTFIFDSVGAAEIYASDNSDIDEYNTLVINAEQYQILGEGKVLLLDINSGEHAVILEALKDK